MSISKKIGLISSVAGVVFGLVVASAVAIPVQISNSDVTKDTVSKHGLCSAQAAGALKEAPEATIKREYMKCMEREGASAKIDAVKVELL